MKIEFTEEDEKKNMPLYTIGVVAELISITAQTLRLYEKHGLVKPSRKKKNRFYSENDIRWILCLRELVHDKKISIEGIKKLLHYAPCWEITMCPEETKNKCLAYRDRAKPCWEINQMICSNKPGDRCEKCIVFISQAKHSRKS
jgi:MerR family transcriptional regulator/heat shock protein HspR